MKIGNLFSHVLIIGLLTTLFLPFVVTTSQLFPFITGKGFAFRILIELLLGIWVVGMFWDPSLRPKFSWIMGSILIFVGTITISDIFGVSLYKSFWSNFERMEGLITLLHLLAYFLIAGSVLNTRARWYTFLNVSVFASVIMSVYAFLQLAGSITINQGGVRLDGTFGNAAYLAVYMLFNFFIALFLLARTYQDKSRLSWYAVSGYGIALVFQSIVMYYTATRGVILGLIGGLLVTVVVVALFERERPKLRRVSIAALAALLLLVGGFFAARNTSFVTSSPTLSRFSSLSLEELNTQGRRYVWPMAIQGFLEKPILGWGQENFNYVFNEHYDPRMYNQEAWFDHAHNIVLDWLVAGGVVGLAGYLAIFATLLFVLWKNKTFSVTDKAIIVGLLAGYFFQNLFVFDNLLSSIYFFSILAFIHSERVKDKTEPLWLNRLSQNLFLSRKIIPVSVVIVVLVCLYGLNIRPILANKNIINALNQNVSRTPEESLEYYRKVFKYNTFANSEASEQMLNQIQKFFGSRVTVETRQAFVELATKNMDEQIKKFPGDARRLLFMGSLRNRTGDYKNAISYLEEAERVSPKKQSILFELGFSYLSVGESEKAFEKFKKAYDLEPSYSEAKILYAIGALHDNQDALGKELVSEITKDGKVFDERIITALAATGNLTEGVALIQKQVQLTPNDPKIRFRLAAGYLSLGQRTKSIETLREAAKLFPEAKADADFYIKEIQAGRNP